MPHFRTFDDIHYDYQGVGTPTTSNTDQKVVLGDVAKPKPFVADSFSFGVEREVK